MKIKIFLKIFLISLVGGVLVFFQNCSAPTQFKQSESIFSSNDGGVNLDLPGKEPVAAQVCTFNGVEYKEGESVVAYVNSTVPFNNTCVSENRVCQNGAFTGTYKYASCSVGGPASCLFNGKQIAHGDKVPAFLASTVAFGATCTSEDRVCDNGTLSGSYTFASCTPGAPAQCNFAGKNIAHGDKVTGYNSSSVAFGQSCSSLERTCNNGILSGDASYKFDSCAVGAPKSCIFNGKPVAHGEKVVANKTSTVPYGESCITEDRICNNGTLSGSYTFESCNVGAPAQCNFAGQNIAHGQTVPAFNASTVAFGQSCSSVSRTCNNGVMSGDATYKYASCSVDAAKSCTFNGATVVHGDSVTAYASSSVAFGSTCSSQQRTCNNGVLSGSNAYSSCSVDSAKSCTFNGATVAHGDSVTAYTSSSVAFGSTCSSQQRTCNNGVLSGSNTYSSCSVDAAKSCTFNGATVAHGNSVTAYATQTVAYGSSCSSQQRTCNNGVLSGSNAYSSCSVAAKPAPTPVCTLAVNPSKLPVLDAQGRSSTGTESFSFNCDQPIPAGDSVRGIMLRYDVSYTNGDTSNSNFINGCSYYQGDVTSTLSADRRQITVTGTGSTQSRYFFSCGGRYTTGSVQSYRISASPWLSSGPLFINSTTDFPIFNMTP